MHADHCDNKSLLIEGYSLINLCICNVLTEWIFFEMDYQVNRKMMVMVTAFEELRMVVSKTKWNYFDLIASLISHK